MLLITPLFKPEACMSFLRNYRMQSRMLIAVPVLSAAIYQLGPFGTAAKKLKEWALKR